MASKRIAPQTDSWWMHLTREQFSREVATRYALNKAEKESQGIGAWAKDKKLNTRVDGRS